MTGNHRCKRFAQAGRNRNLQRPRRRL
jgi:hypothetical protein